MLEGLYSAAAGMTAQQEQMNAISEDLANVSTTGYKAERVAFSDLLYNRVDIAGTESSTGSGASARVIGRSEAQGSIEQTGEPLDLAIEGSGYFQVTLPSGKLALTRDGSFGVDANGTLVNSQGDRLSPPIKLPKGVAPGEVTIAPDGTVTAGTRKLGQIKLVSVTSPEHLLADGGGELTATAQSGAPRAATGKIHQGALEASNVNIASEMAQMVSTERAYQLTSTAIQDESQMMSIANELRPSS
ncbi:MAG TPA: flagellar hook-basal body protein [Solirubrobacteraceae bacterium]|nr:flagellar hook-basal body protein [Solirubrobacteraceae bacterium]